MITSGELQAEVQTPGLNNFNNPDPNWPSMARSLRPSGAIETATDPHAEVSYSDQQLFPHSTLRKSAVDISQRRPGLLRVERAVRQRSSNPVEKNSLPTQSHNPYSAGLGFPEPFDMAPENPFESNPPLGLQYSPANPEPDFGWWQ